MNFRTLVAAATAFASLSFPLAANADAPAGDFDEIFGVDRTVQIEDPRNDYEAYVEHWLEDAIAANQQFAQTETREQRGTEIAVAPLEITGA